MFASYEQDHVACREIDDNFEFAARPAVPPNDFSRDRGPCLFHSVDAPRPWKCKDRSWVRHGAARPSPPAERVALRAPPSGRESRRPDFGSQSKARERYAIAISIRRVYHKSRPTGRSEPPR
jgi:hypothetical protein